MMIKDKTNQMLEHFYAVLQTDAVPRLDCAEVPPFILFASLSDGKKKAITFCVKANSFKDCWRALKEKVCQQARHLREGVRWLRLDRVDAVEEISWKELNRRLSGSKRNYFRYGIALDRQFKAAFLETELNANAMLYGGPKIEHACINKGNFARYMRTRKVAMEWPVQDENKVYQFSTVGFFISADDMVVHHLEPVGRNTGRRVIQQLNRENTYKMIASASTFLASQVKQNGRFIYGWYPSFDREIEAYNSLRHASTLYSMIDAWEITRDEAVLAAIHRSLEYLTSELIKVITNKEREMAFLVDEGAEIKLGGNAVCVLALVKYTEVTGDLQYLDLLSLLCSGILFMQDQLSGRFNHVLNYPDLSIKEPFRIVYYDGEAAFGLMRLYALTRNENILEHVEKAFEYFINAERWKANDHWLSYATNELTRYRPQLRYFEFGIKNFSDHLDFVIERITTYPTLLELMMAAQEMIRRLQAMPEMASLISSINLGKFYRALEARAHYLVNGYFWPELAMFFANPERILGSFFIRHHAFRTRIDDVEHYLSGFCAYYRYLGEDSFPTRPGIAPGGGKTQVWTAHNVHTATNGRWIVAPPLGWSADGLAIATSTFQANQMVVARTGDQKKGIAVSAIAKLQPTPSAIITASREPQLLALGLPVLLVDDVDNAIINLGRYARANLDATIIGVTGSAGKTSCVAMIAHALSAYGITDHSTHNANLPHGVAWNLASFNRDASNVVVEMAIGRMGLSADIVRPNIAVFTNIQPVHLANAQTIVDIARTKSQIFRGMRPNDIAILNREMLEWETVLRAAQAAKLRIIRYGFSDDCEFRLLDYDASNGRVSVMTPHGELQYKLGAVGRHMALNSLIVLAIAAAKGIDAAPAVTALETFKALPGRGEGLELRIAGRSVRVIDDAYNANPGSMVAALERLHAEPTKGRRIAVLGEMAELGQHEVLYHTQLAETVNGLSIDKVYAVGRLYEHFWKKLKPKRRGALTLKLDELPAILLNDIQTDDTLLFKGSHGTKLHELVGTLKKLNLVDGNSQSDKLAGASVIAFDVLKGKLLFSQEAEALHRPASLAKLVTVCLVEQRIKEHAIDRNQLISISSTALQIDGRWGFAEGEQVSLDTLIRANLIISANEASNALAEWHSGDVQNFVGHMNAYATAIGMRNSVFSSPSGLGRGQFMSAHDALTLTHHIYKTFPHLVATSSEPFFQHGERRSKNLNSFIGSIDGITGLKTGSLGQVVNNIIVTRRKDSSFKIFIVMGACDRRKRDELAATLIEEYS